MNPIINYDLTYIDLYSIEHFIYFWLKNDIYICPKYGYGQDDKNINENVKNYYKIIENSLFPKFIFIGFNLSLPEDLYDIDGEIN